MFLYFVKFFESFDVLMGMIFLLDLSALIRLLCPVLLIMFSTTPTLSVLLDAFRVGEDVAVSLSLTSKFLSVSRIYDQFFSSLPNSRMCRALFSIG